jgi:long-subunit fatty acid transport protein
MKKWFKLILLSMGGVFVINFSLAQVTPATLGLLFSQTNYGGTARIRGIGEANTALGGDISSISSNPAGLGFYNRSEVSFTPVLSLNSTNTTYLDNSTSATSTRFGIGNIGIALNSKRPDNIPGSWKGGTFGFSYNRLKDFNNEVIYSGTNIDNDYLDFVLDFANTNEAQIGDYYLVDLPYETYLINDYSVDNNGDTTFNVWDTFVEYASPDTPVDQEERIVTSGSLNKWSISYGGNVSDRFYFGFGLGVMSLRYENEKTYSEIRYPESILDHYTLYEKQEVTGTGVNGSLGITVRPINTLTIGVLFVTPTAYTLTDKFETNIHSIWNESALDYYGDDPFFTGDQTAGQTPDDWTYTLNTPMRLNTGLAFFFNKNGFITADIEWVDYSKIKFRFDQGDINQENEAIKEMYKSVINYRIGGEYRTGSLRIRAGYNYLNNPLVDTEDVNKAKSTYSAGIGYRKQKFYIDMSVLYSTSKGVRIPYIIYEDQGIGPTPVADINYNTTQFIFTGGFYF